MCTMINGNSLAYPNFEFSILLLMSDRVCSPAYCICLSKYIFLKIEEVEKFLGGLLIPNKIIMPPVDRLNFSSPFLPFPGNSHFDS